MSPQTPFLLPRRQQVPLEHSLLDAASDDESTTTIGQHADSLIEEAHQALVVPATPMEDFTSMLTNVVRDVALLFLHSTPVLRPGQRCLVQRLSAALC